MNVYIVNDAGRPVSFDVAFTDEAGASVTPDSVYWRVVDATGTVRQAWTNVPLSGGETSVTVTVPATVNVLDPDVLSDVRKVEIELRFAAGGAVPKTHHYGLRRRDFLVVPSSSFQTYEEALATALNLMDIDGWNEADEDMRMVALLRSYQVLTKLGFYIHDEIDRQRVIVRPGDRHIVPDDWDDMELSEFQAFPERFRSALKRAQILDANARIEGDAYSSQRDGGLLSESIGESSIMFRSVPPVKSTISDAAMSELSRWVTRKVVINRV